MIEPLRLEEPVGLRDGDAEIQKQSTPVIPFPHVVRIHAQSMHLEQSFPHPNQVLFGERTVNFREVLDEGAEWLSLSNRQIQVARRTVPCIDIKALSQLFLSCGWNGQMAVTAHGDLSVHIGFDKSSISATFIEERIGVKADGLDRDLVEFFWEHAACSIFHIKEFELLVASALA